MSKLESITIPVDSLHHLTIYFGACNEVLKHDLSRDGITEASVEAVLAYQNLFDEGQIPHVLASPLAVYEADGRGMNEYVSRTMGPNAYTSLVPPLTAVALKMQEKAKIVRETIIELTQYTNDEMEELLGWKIIGKLCMPV
jgi:hypothetical protein